MCFLLVSLVFECDFHLLVWSIKLLTKDTLNDVFEVCFIHLGSIMTSPHTFTDQNECLLIYYI